MSRHRTRPDVRSLIRDRGTVTEAARAAGISCAHLAGILAGRQKPFPRVAAALASCAERSVGDLFPELRDREEVSGRQ